MSWTPPAAPTSPAPDDPGRSRRARSRALVGTAVLVALLLAVGGAAWALVDGIDRRSTAAPAGPSGGVDGWDPRVADLADVVAEERGRPFLRPVAVRFLEDDEFEASVAASGEPDEEEVAALDTATAQLRALGLIAADVDLRAEVEALVGGGTLAYYDSEEELVTVRGTDLDVAGRVTVVHELTHAWQDQHFDLDRVDGLDTLEGETLRALAEGDARRVEEAYLATLTDAERREHQRLSTDAADLAGAQLEGIPDVLQASFASPYALGPAFVSILEREGGEAEVDAAFTDPPASDADLIDPRRWFDGAEPLDVAAPEPPGGEEVLDEAEFGAVSWLFALGARLDPRLALDALDGWAGDRAVTYRDGERGCVAVAVRGVDAGATARWEDVLEDWADAGPDGAAAVAREGDDVVLRACEDPAIGEPAAGRVSLALDYAALRLVVVDQVLDELGASLDQAACFGDRVAEQVPPDELEADRPVSAEEGQRRGTAAAAACL